MELHEDRTEAERLLAAVWEYEDRSPSRKTSLPKWLFVVTLTGTVISTFSPSDVVAPIMTALAPAPEKLSVDKVSSENVGEDLDYRIAQHAKSLAGWQGFLEAHPDGPHAQAAHAEIERLLPTPPPQPVEVAEQSPPSPAATQTLVNAAQPAVPPAPTPVMVEKEPAPPAVKIVEPPAPAPAPQPVMVMREQAPPPLLRPPEIAVANSVEPAHRSHRRADHHQTSQPNVFAALVAQLFHRHRQRLNIKLDRGWR